MYKSRENSEETTNVLDIKSRARIFYIVVFVLIMTFPLIMFPFSGKTSNLSGAYEKEELSFDNFSAYLKENLPGRDIVIRLLNQVKYTVFNISGNGTVAIGEDKELFSSESLNYYTHGLYYVDENAISTLVDKLNLLNDICNGTGKKLIVTTTPTKIRYYEDKMPFVDIILNAFQEKKYVRPYDVLAKELNKTNIKFFDCIEYINENENKLTKDGSRVFPQTGHHWSTFNGKKIGLAFRNYIEQSTNYKLPKIRIIATPSDIPEYPDADLYDILNLIEKPRGDYYETSIKYDSIELSMPSFLISGGSFTGELLFQFFTFGIDNEVIHISNKTCLLDHYERQVEFEDYSELPILENLKKIDIIVLEINELNVYNATFGLLDYLLENKNKF